MKTRALLFGWLLSTVTLSAQTSLTRSFTHGGIVRDYRIYIPSSYTGAQAVPLVLNLHGYTSDAQQQEIYTDFKSVADTANFILVHPNGSIQPGTANTRFWNIALSSALVDDVAFLSALVDTVSAHYRIDPTRVYSAGMSNGGYMSIYLACQTQRFAAVASVTGSMTTNMYSGCNPVRPIPLMQIHGTADPTVPYNGGSGSRSVPEVVAFWVNKNQCAPVADSSNVPDLFPGDGATARHFLYSGGTDGHTVEHYKVFNGGHTWPGAQITIGTTCKDFSATKEIWRFFSQYRNLTAGINEAEKPVWNLWPNPAGGQVSVELPGKTITRINVIDMQGRTVLQNASSQGLSTIDVNGLKPGHYTLQIAGKDFVWHKLLSVAR